MNNQASLRAFRHFFNQGTLSILYQRNKKYLFPFVTILVSIILSYVVIVPQIQYYFFLKEEEKNIEEKIIVLKNNIRLLSTLDESDLDKKLQIVSTALPPEKDFAGVLGAISQAAATAGVAVGDFTFQLGALTDIASTVSKTPGIKSGQPTIEVVLYIASGVEGSRRFMRELLTRLPLSEIRRVDINDKSSTITVGFYYKPFPPLQFDGGIALQPLSGKDIETINELISN